MNPITPHIWTAEERARYGIRGMEDFSAEELALLQEKVAGWTRQRPPHPKSAPPGAIRDETADRRASLRRHVAEGGQR
jgi:hypothetical protein